MFGFKIQTSGLPLPAARQGREGGFRLKILDDILRSKDDNDPRLDAAFNDLSSAEKKLFIRKYRELPPEARNERGTIIYLLGRNVRTPSDWAFLRSVAGEKPCLSLSDCSKKPSPGGEEEAAAAGDAVTLAYPSLVALTMARREMERLGPSQEALSVLSAGKASRSQAVRRLARKIARQFQP